jgi:thymidylate synthase
MTKIDNPVNHNHPEDQYLNLILDIVQNGDDVPDRTGVGTRKCHGRTMRFDLRDGTIPLFTTKRVAWHSVRTELLWFLRGESNIRSLLQEKVTIWSEWPHKKYVEATGDAITVKEFEKRVLEDEAFAQQWGDLGPVYGVQWRSWKGADGKVFDQIQDTLNRLQKDPYSRRALFHGWNVAHLDEMALPPCHLLYQFYVNSKKELSLTLYQRSCDVGLGVPFNVASAATLVHIFARELGLTPGELFWVGHDVHLYRNHIDALMEQQVERDPRPFPVLKIVGDRPWHALDPRDLVVEGYDPHPKIDLPVAV